MAAYLKPVLLQPSGCWVGVGSCPSSSGDGDFGVAQDDVWRGQVDGWGVAWWKVLAPMVTLLMGGVVTHFLLFAFFKETDLSEGQINNLLI